MNKEKFDTFLTKNMQAIIGLITIIVVAFAGYFLAKEFVRLENMEIKSLSYKEVKLMAEMQPEMIPLINKALSDGKISKREYNDLRQKRFDMLDKSEIEKNKGDLIDYLNK